VAKQDQKASAAVGRAGEHLALSRLSLAGYTCTLCQIKDHDAYIQTDTRTLTLQVKTSSKTYKNSQSYPFFTPRKNVGTSDIFAFVAINLNAVVFRRGDELSTVTTYVTTEEFLNDSLSMQKTLDSFVVI
tara:strand:+ start:413 stop:802 length:390 start_codon:yes stop_codon:yes gene_type:complete